MRKIFEIVFGVAAVVIAVLIALYAKDNYMSSVTLMQIPVPKAEIEPYTLLDSSHFVMAEFPRALLEKNSAYALEMDDLVGRMTTTRLVSGLPVARSLIALPQDFRLADPDKLVLSIPVTPENAVGGQIQIGERVNIFRIAVEDSSKSVVSQDDSNNETQVVSDAAIAEMVSAIPDLKDLPTIKVQLVATVPVINILSSKGTPLGPQSANGGSSSILGGGNQGDSGSPLAILLVAVPREQAEDIMRLIGMTNKGGELMWLSLAALNDVSQAEAEPVAQFIATPTEELIQTAEPTVAPTAVPTATPFPTPTPTMNIIEPSLTVTPTLDVSAQALPTATSAAVVTSEAGPNCDPAYPDVCIWLTTSTMTCDDIPFRNFTVLQPDPHGFDLDGDGIGCEAK